jgi:D-alanyl-D-alanine carboxypeptidase
MRLLLLRALKPVSILLLGWAVAFVSVLPAAAGVKFSTIVVDARTGTLLSAEDPDGSRQPASLTKMMTLYILFQDLKAGRVKLNTPLKVSRRAASMAPSKLGLRTGSTITVEQAIRALVIKSANDAAATVGENLGGGSEAAFANRMTRVARQIGMRRTTFKNASGLPNAGQVTTARDMATLGLHLMRDFPQYYPYFRSTAFVYNGRVIRGHNRLVGRFPGTDGIKTGYINASGYNLVTSTKRGGKRVVGVVMGARSSGTRNAYMMRIITRAMGKARDGNTIAAVAGSSLGVINPLAKAKLAQQQSEDVEANVEADKDLLAAVSAEAAVDSKEDGEDETAEALSAPEPKVLEAELVSPARRKESDPKKLPFAVKPSAVTGEDLTVASLPDSYTVQINGLKSKKDAQATLSNMRATIGKDMKNKTTQTVAVQGKGKVTYRVLIAGFSEKLAKKSCAMASRMGKVCAVVANEG